MLKDDCGVEVSECYTTVDHALKYTLIRLKTKLRQTAMQKVVGKLVKKHAIVIQEIFGYNAISSTTIQDEEKIEEHPAFRVIATHFNEDKLSLESWIEDEGTSGLLTKHTVLKCYTQLNVKSLSKARITAILLDMQCELMEARKRKREMQTMYASEQSKTRRLEAELNVMKIMMKK